MRKGIRIEEVQLGAGPVAEKGKTVTVRYDGFLSRGDSFQKGETVSFKLGRREVIAGLEYGVEGMRVGGRRRIRVSPHLAYGDKGVEGVIPANAVLILDVELLAAEDDS
jgi:FKBP-type peptidyl-prolyl cis-trans isomerase